MEKKKVLTICKSSYNRKHVLIPDIEEYLSVKDDRFLIKVNDNCSTDGTVEALSKIKDSRLSYFVNKKNEGPMPNSIAALSNAESEYVMLVLDKDTIDVALLPSFIDFLEVEKPNFGFVDLSNCKTEELIQLKAGYDCLSKIGFHCKHPSGYFWRSDLWNQEIKKGYFKKIDKQFDFPFEIVNGNLGALYDGVIVVRPIVINATLRAIPNTETRTYFDEDKFFFGKKKLIITEKYFLSSLFDLKLSQKDLTRLSYDILINITSYITIDLHRTYLHKQKCSYYHLPYRHIGCIEMLKNMIDVIKIYHEISNLKIKQKTKIYHTIKILIHFIPRIIIISFKDKLVQPRQDPIKCQ